NSPTEAYPPSQRPRQPRCHAPTVLCPSRLPSSSSFLFRPEQRFGRPQTLACPADPRPTAIPQIAQDLHAPRSQCPSPRRGTPQPPRLRVALVLLRVRQRRSIPTNSARPSAAKPLSARPSPSRCALVRRSR